LQYRRLSIPHIGTFELEQQVPEFNVVDKLIRPPSFRLNWNGNDTPPEHQLSYLAASIQSDKQKIREELDSFGRKLKRKVQKESFTWNGVGTVSKEAGGIAIEDRYLRIDGLEAVAAHKLIRENAEHNILVGDHEVSSRQTRQILPAWVAGQKSYAVLIGWILFLLTLLAIIFILYKNGFNPLSSGLQTKATKAVLDR